MNARYFRIKFLMCAAGAVAMNSCSANANSNSDSDTAESNNAAVADTASHNILVCYFSATGTTARQAERIAEMTGGTLHEIVPEKRYSDADLDWRDSTSRSSVEMKDRTSRPAVKDAKMDMSSYDVVYIGFPNWWNTAPTIIYTFIEANDLNGKRLIPFMTSGGSDIVQSEKDLKRAYPSLDWQKGILMNGVSDEDLREFVSGK